MISSERKKYFNYFLKKKRLDHIRINQIFDETSLEGIIAYYDYIYKAYLNRGKHENER